MSAPIAQLVSTFHGIHSSERYWGDIYQGWCRDHAPHMTVRDVYWGTIHGWQMYMAKYLPLWMRDRRKRGASIMMTDAEIYRPQCLRHHVIAHSYGTQFVTDMLYENPEIKIDGLILVGSVLPERFYKTRLPELILNGQIERVLNVWSRNDDVIRNFSCGPYGKAGWIGFQDLDGTEPVWQNQTEENHNSYFWREFREEHFTRWTMWLDDPRGFHK